MAIELTDMDKVEALTGGAMLPIGRHQTMIVDAEEGTSSGGFDQIEIKFESLAGVGDIRDWLVFAPAKDPGEVPFAVRKAKALLECCGIEAQGGKSSFPTKDLIGKKLEIIVGEEPDYKDPTKMRRRVQAYNPISTGSDVPGSNTPNDPIPF